MKSFRTFLRKTKAPNFGAFVGNGYVVSVILDLWQIVSSDLFEEMNSS